MKKDKLKSWLSAIFVSVIFVGVLASCAKKTDPTPAISTPTVNPYPGVDSWVYSIFNNQMLNSEGLPGYFWSANLPALSSLDTTSSPWNFFGKLIYQPTTADRFSFISDSASVVENEFNAVSTEFGFESGIQPYELDSTSKQITIGFFLSYVVKGSPADLAGLQRGQVIMQVNGTQITAANYQTLVGSSLTQTFTLGKQSGNTFVADPTQVFTVTQAAVVEDPVAFSTVIDNSATTGKKIGYVLYTQFVPGLATGDTAKYDNEMRQVFANFKSQNVNELVLDLRLNPGGDISSATILSSLIVKGLSTNNVFYQDQFNAISQAAFVNYFGQSYFQHYFQNEANNIGGNLSRVFILTSNDTYSASEMVINELKPYMNVITIGDHTGGKNLEAYLIDGTYNGSGGIFNYPNWIFYYMIGQTANALGQSSYGNINGIAPTYPVADNPPYLTWGNPSENLLSQALQVMGTSTQRASARVGLNPVAFKRLASIPKTSRKYLPRMIIRKKINLSKLPTVLVKKVK